MSPFKDLDGTEWFYADAVFMYNRGLLAGFPADGGVQFYPSRIPDGWPRHLYESGVVRDARLFRNEHIQERWAEQTLRATVAPAIVHIKAGAAIGAGTVVHPSGVVATCHHVVADAGLAELQCAWPHWEEPGVPRGQIGVPMRIIAEDPDNDLALCQIVWPVREQNGSFPWLPLAAVPAEPAEPVAIIGSPGGLTGWESHGHIANPNMTAMIYRSPQEVIPVAGAINPGNSGGALIRKSEASLLGVVNGKLVHLAFEGIGFAIPAHILASLMDRKGVHPPWK